MLCRTLNIAELVVEFLERKILTSEEKISSLVKKTFPTSEEEVTLQVEIKKDYFQEHLIQLENFPPLLSAKKSFKVL